MLDGPFLEGDLVVSFALVCLLNRGQNRAFTHVVFLGRYYRVCSGCAAVRELARPSRGLQPPLPGLLVLPSHRGEQIHFSRAAGQTQKCLPYGDNFMFYLKKSVFQFKTCQTPNVNINAFSTRAFSRAEAVGRWALSPWGSARPACRTGAVHLSGRASAAAQGPAPAVGYTALTPRAGAS